MVTTRDIVIFICVILFLLLGIAVSLFKDTVNDTLSLSFNTLPIETQGAIVAVSTLNREENINRLRGLLEVEEPEVTPEPSVEEEDVVEEEEEKDLNVKLCQNSTTIDTVIRNWPLKDIKVSEDGVRRQVVHTVEVALSTTSASSTATQAEEQILLTLPVSPSPLSLTQCIEGDVVGITPDGALLFNSDATRYRSYDENTLIGYARDGYPIYGMYEGEVDMCGGYEKNGIYRYTLSGDRSFIVGCFKAIPFPFSVN